MKTKSENLQPKMLPGYVRGERIKCGKPNCQCANGALHGKYFYRYVWENGKRIKFYVKRGEVKAVSAACTAWRADAKRRRQQAQSTAKQLRELKASLRESETILRAFIGRL